MLRWNHWTIDRCPSCTTAIEDTSHLIDCQEIGCQAYLSQLITQVEQNLINQHVPPLAVTTMLHTFFPYCTQVQGLTPMMLQLQHMQTHLNECKWGLPSLHWRSSLEQFILDPTKAHVSQRWLVCILKQLWNTAWDMWRYRNGIVHNSQVTAHHEKICQEVRHKYAKGYNFLPPQEYHWIQTPLSTMLKKPTSILTA